MGKNDERLSNTECALGISFFPSCSCVRDHSSHLRTLCRYDEPEDGEEDAEEEGTDEGGTEEEEEDEADVVEKGKKGKKGRRAHK